MSLSVRGEYFSPPHKHTKDTLTCGCVINGRPAQPPELQPHQGKAASH